MNTKIMLLTVVLVLLTIASITFFYPVHADSVTVLSSSSFIDPIGDYHIVGELQNMGSNTVDYVQVTATYYDANNKVVDTQSTFAALSYMQPNAKSPFYIIETTSTLVPKISTYKLQVSSRASGSIQQGLEITSNSSYTDSIGDFHIDGEIQNIGFAASSNTWISATCFDSSGKVVDAGFTFIPQAITSGGTSPFQITITHITDSTQIPLIASYSLTAQSSEYALISANSSPSPTATSTLTSTSTPLTQSTSSPTPTVPEFPTLLILPLFAVVILLSIVFIRKRIPKK